MAELLIVVAVIAVLVAVAIPTFSNQLEKSRQAVDISALRQAYAAARIAEMDGMIDGKKISEYQGQIADHENSNIVIFWFNPETGILTPVTDDNDTVAGAIAGGYTVAMKAKAREQKNVLVSTDSLSDKVLYTLSIDDPVQGISVAYTRTGPAGSNTYELTSITFYNEPCYYNGTYIVPVNAG